MNDEVLPFWVPKISKNSSRPKQQHYVPQYYLRAFGESDEYIWVFDKLKLRSFKAQVRNVGAENHFYNVPETDDPLLGERESFEKLLAIVDESHAEILSVLGRFGGKPAWLNAKWRNIISQVLAFQIVRTRSFRDEFAARCANWARAQLEPKLQEAGLDVNLAKWRIGLTDEAQAVYHIEAIFSDKLIGPVIEDLQKYIWAVGRNSTGRPLLTSDNPVARKPHPGIPGNNPRSVGAEIAFPVSPRILLVLHYPDASVPFSLGDVCEFEMSKKEVDYYNSFQVFSCARQVYGPSDGFRKVAALCEKIGPKEWVRAGGAATHDDDRRSRR